MNPKILKKPYFYSAKMAPQKVDKLITLKVDKLITLWRPKGGQTNNSPAYIYICWRVTSKGRFLPFRELTPVPQCFWLQPEAKWEFLYHRERQFPYYHGAAVKKHPQNVVRELTFFSRYVFQDLGLIAPIFKKQLNTHSGTSVLQGTNSLKLWCFS